jgi:hypothetical protein
MEENKALTADIESRFEEIENITYNNSFTNEKVTDLKNLVMPALPPESEKDARIKELEAENGCLAFELGSEQLELILINRKIATQADYIAELREALKSQHKQLVLKLNDSHSANPSWNEHINHCGTCELLAKQKE